MFRQVGLPSCTAICTQGSSQHGDRRAERAVAHCSTSQQSKRSKARATNPRPPAPCHSAAASVSWQEVATPPSSTGFWSPQLEETSADTNEEQQRGQQGSSPAITRLNVDLGLWRERVARHKAQRAPSKAQRAQWQAESEKILLKCLQLDPFDARSYVALGRLYVRQKRLNEAASLYEQGCAVTEGSNCHIWQSWAVLEQRRGNISKSRQYYEAATIARQDHAASWHGWGLLERRAGNEYRARDIWLQGIRNTRHCPNAHLYQSLAMLAADMNCPAAARKWFEEGTRLLEGSQAVALWQAWGLLEQRLGNLDQARTLYQQGLEALPYNRFLLLAHGQLEKEAGNISHARTLLKFGLKNNPLDTALVQALGCLEAEDGNVDAARELFKRGTDLQPESLYLWQAWGVLEFRQGELAEARHLFQQGVWADPASQDVALVWQAWAVLEWRCQNVTLARRMFQCAMRADPRNAAALGSWIAMESVEGDKGLAAELKQRQLQDDVQVVQPSNIAATFDLDAAEAPLQALFTNVRNWMNRVGSSSMRSNPSRGGVDSTYLRRPPPLLDMGAPDKPSEETKPQLRQSNHAYDAHPADNAKSLQPKNARPGRPGPKVLASQQSQSNKCPGE